MTNIEIVQKYHGEVNKLYAEKSKAVAHIERGYLYKKYITILDAMLKGGTLTKEDYDDITSRMILIGLSKI